MYEFKFLEKEKEKKEKEDLLGVGLGICHIKSRLALRVEVDSCIRFSQGLQNIKLYGEKFRVQCRRITGYFLLQCTIKYIVTYPG